MPRGVKNKPAERTEKQTDEGLRVPAIQIRKGDRVVFRGVESGRAIAREVLEVESEAGQVRLTFRFGRGRSSITVPSAQELLLPGEKNRSRFVLA